ncbi:PRC-barrel domain-containing protein [Trujillonella humicola]|uniref:PRC-barrel domain-containing protein n=1 Tax=Trujillonella humicola TaxID=3383699 RepID=UPI0039062D6F
MTTDEIGQLYRLGDTDKTVADPAADVRGRQVVDADGEDVGRVEDLLVDDAEGRVRFLRVGEGGFLGLGGRHFLVPVEAVVGIDPETVRISRDRGAMANVPTYDPQLTDAPEHYGAVYGWWGYPPFWGPGYAYPPFPRF